MMPTKRAAVAILMLAAAFSAGSAYAVQARSGEHGHESQVPEVDATSSVTMGMLSVKPLGADKPWDPRVCIGCDRNNQPSSLRTLRSEVR